VIWRFLRDSINQIRLQNGGAKWMILKGLLQSMRHSVAKLRSAIHRERSKKITMTVVDKMKTRAAGNGGTDGDHDVPTHQEIIAWVQNCERGMIISHVKGQCFGHYGPVWRKWDKLDPRGSFLGWPASDVLPTQIDGELFAHFANGAVALRPNANEAFEVHGARHAPRS